MRTGVAYLAGFAILLGGQSAMAQDIANGRQIFDMCLACHETGGPGPRLNGVFERKIGSVDGFVYSEALVAANNKAMLWTEDALSQFLAAPQTYLPDNKMAFGAVTDKKDRADLIAYLKTLR